MTHEELLAKINKNALITARLFGWVGNKKESNALRAVVELHKPFNGFINKDKLFCEVCTEGNPPDSYPYPCPTIQAIQKELN